MRSRSRHALHFAGLAREGFGIALWQADGTGPEPAATGHTFVTPLRPITSHYYIASRDYIDPAARGTAVLRETHGLGAFPEALRAAGASAGDLVVRLPLLTPGRDREGEDWFYRDGVETRHLALRGSIELRFKETPVIELPVARLVLTEDYRGATEFADVRLSIVSDAFRPRMAPVGDASARRLGEALLDGLAGNTLRIVVDAIRLLPETFYGQGRFQGRYAEMPSARIETTD